MIIDDKKATIVIVDDTESNIDIVQSLLCDYDVLPSMNGYDALELIQNEDVDLILLDILMPEIDGLEVCRRLKADTKTVDIPVIFLTAMTDEETIEKAYEVGGVDYVAKPFKPKELLARVKTHIEMRDMIKKLEFMASKDPLTGLYNRRKFFELGQKMFDSCGDNLYAVMADIDHFKRINDTHGHQAGDVALKAITQSIQNSLPSDALFGRLGGEEFAILFKALTKDEALCIINSARISVEKLNIDSTNSHFSCTISNGLSFKHEAIKTIDELLKEADEALYEAKKSGRNRSLFRGQAS